MGVHESHKKRFCQGCYRFTHLPLASTQVRPRVLRVVSSRGRLSYGGSCTTKRRTSRLARVTPTAPPWQRTHQHNLRRVLAQTSARRSQRA